MFSHMPTAQGCTRKLPLEVACCTNTKVKRGILGLRPSVDPKQVEGRGGLGEARGGSEFLTISNSLHQ